MNDSSVKNTLEVTNFGPIAEAKIDLRPLTVFVGPSNTGKSYLAVLIYALHRHFSRRSDEMRYWNPAERDTLRDALAEWMQAIDEGLENMAGNHIMLPDPVKEGIRLLIHGQGAYFGKELRRCFGMGETRSLIRKGSRQNARVVFGSHLAKDSVPFEQAFEIGTNGSDAIRTVIPEGLSLSADRQVPINSDLPEADYLLWKARVTAPMIVREDKGLWNASSQDLMEHVFERVLPQLLGALHAPAHYLPADRTGVMRAYRVLLGSLIDQASQPGHNDPTPDLSGVVGDFLKQLVRFGNLPDLHLRNRGTPPLAEDMEKHVLAGSVHIETSPTGLPSFFYRPRGWKKALPLMHASSMISELAPVVLYLRYVVRPGETLIIDEPEAHLHPAMQAEFTRQIAAFVRSGLQVIVTTHSEWVLETLANLVRASKLPEERRKGIESADPALRPDQVGAWLFRSKNRPKGSVVEKLELDTETGLFQTDFDPVSEALYNEGIGISNLLQGGGRE